MCDFRHTTRYSSKTVQDRRILSMKGEKEVQRRVKVLFKSSQMCSDLTAMRHVSTPIIRMHRIGYIAYQIQISVGL